MAMDAVAVEETAGHTGLCRSSRDAWSRFLVCPNSVVNRAPLAGTDFSKGSRSGFVAKWFFSQVFWKLGVRRHTNHTSYGKSGCLALPPKAARPHNYDFIEKVFFLAVVPQASKKHLANKSTTGSLIILKLSRLETGRSPAPKTDVLPENIIV